MIIFDEVQLAPKARQAIEYLVKDHRYDYIETGSLISIRKNIQDILIPSEEIELTMYSMDYEEFKWAMDDKASIPLLSQCFAARCSLGDTGLFLALAFLDSDFAENVIYEKLLGDKLSADLGYVYENVVAQMLRASGHELYYYTFPTDSGKHNYEIDFLIADDIICLPTYMTMFL